MSIILLILKIIGITILSIIGILLLALLLVLFVPVRYSIVGNKSEETFAVSAGVSWLMHIIRVKVSYSEELSYFVKALFFTIIKSENLFSEKEKLHREKREQKKKFKEEKKRLKEEKKREKEKDNTETKDEIADADTTSTEEILNICSDNSVQNINPDINDDIDEDRKSFIDKVLFVLEKFIDLIFNISDKIFDIINKITEIWDNLDFYVDALNDERNQNAISICLLKIKGILANIRPRKIKGYLHIGSDDPYIIGKMMSIYSILLPIIHDKIQMVPDYEREVYEGDICIKGHITVFVALKLLYVYYFNKDVRRMKKIFKSHKI